MGNLIYGLFFINLKLFIKKIVFFINQKTKL